MKNTQHTPGPWSAVFGNGLLSVSVQAPTTHVCLVSKLPTLRCEEAEANARLIAAAPELLAALQKAETWMATFAGTVGNPAGPLAADLAEVRELLRKTLST